MNISSLRSKDMVHSDGEFEVVVRKVWKHEGKFGFLYEVSSGPYKGKFLLLRTDVNSYIGTGIEEEKKERLPKIEKEKRPVKRVVKQPSGPRPERIKIRRRKNE
jgi:hypothetical protein